MAQVIIDGITTTTTATTQADITFIDSTRTVTPSAPGLLVQLPDTSIVSDIAIFVRKRDVKLQLTNLIPREATLIWCQSHRHYILL